LEEASCGDNQSTRREEGDMGIVWTVLAIIGLVVVLQAIF
jgi:hypothetical protein